MQQMQQEMQALTDQVRRLAEENEQLNSQTVAAEAASSAQAAVSRSVTEMHQKIVEFMDATATRFENISKPQKRLMDVKGLERPHTFDNVQSNWPEWS